MTEFVVETRSLVKRYGRVAALDGLSMEVPRGAVYGFLGRNGAGKTTAIRVLAGLARPQSGEARVFGLREQGCRGSRTATNTISTEGGQGVLKF